MDHLAVKWVDTLRADSDESKPMDPAGALQRVLQGEGTTKERDGTPRDTTTDAVVGLIFWVAALVIAVRCRGAKFDSVLLALFFPRLYVIIYVARQLLGDKSGACYSTTKEYYPQGGQAPPPPPQLVYVTQPAPQQQQQPQVYYAQAAASPQQGQYYAQPAPQGAQQYYAQPAPQPFYA